MRYRALAETIAGLGLLRGPIRLASGEVSDTYVDMRLVTMHPLGLSCVSRALHDEIGSRIFTHIGGVAHGATPLVAVAVFEGRHTYRRPGFLVDGGNVKGCDPVGGTAILLEDVTTTGSSVLRAVSLLRRRECEVREVVSVVDREQGAAEALARAGVSLVSLTTLREVLAA